MRVSENFDAADYREAAIEIAERSISVMLELLPLLKLAEDLRKAPIHRHVLRNMSLWP